MTIRRTTLVQGPPGPPGPPATYVSQNFTVPAVNATVPVTFHSTVPLVVGGTVWVQTAGLFTVASVTDNTHAVLTNVSATPSSTVTAPQVCIPTV